MKKCGVLFFIVLLVSFNMLAQCPVSVSISTNSNSPTCRNVTVNFTPVPINGGSNPSYYWLVFGDTVSTDAVFSTSVNGAHVELIMISNSGCSQDSAYTDYYINSVDLEATYEVIVVECNQPKADVQINSIGGGSAPFTYFLYTDDGPRSGSDYFVDLPISSYPIIITDASGCVDSSWIDVVVPKCPPITPMEVFTPNDDGFNDTWVINSIGRYPKNKVYVYDRWGQRVYYKQGYTNVDGWDAKYLALDMPVSTYYYVIELEFEKQEKQIFKGPVSILR